MSSASSPRARSGRLPRHIGLIPDGNRRWADARGFARGEGYAAGIEPGLRLLDACRSLGIPEATIYGYTKENVRRPADQVAAFRRACVAFANRAAEGGAALLVVGDMRSRSFPPELRRFATRTPGDLRVNLLANYGWQWDVRAAVRGDDAQASRDGARAAGGLLLESRAVPRVELIVRWGGRRRLSGFLPLQSAHADIHVVDTLWPDMELDDLHAALEWYATQDVTLGG